MSNGGTFTRARNRGGRSISRDSQVYREKILLDNAGKYLVARESFFCSNVAKTFLRTNVSTFLWSMGYEICLQKQGFYLPCDDGAMADILYET